jgi:hypothetical protein
MISRAKAERFLPGRLFVKLVHAIPPGDSRMGPLKKVASGVLAIFLCSRI